MKKVEINDVQFVGNSAMLVSLSNHRTFIVPLDSFKEIAELSAGDRKNFEIIDGENLSFLKLDGIYNLHDLIGVEFFAYHVTIISDFSSSLSLLPRGWQMVECIQ